MGSENKSIGEFSFELVCEYFSGLERQGPGSPAVTLKALGFIENLHEHSRIADIGCGTGGQTLVLAGNAPGEITAFDLFPGFVERLNRSAARENLGGRVRGVIASMDALPLREASLDLIWSEGAIYNIGFVRGLNEWRKFLKPGAYIAVTEISWFTRDRPGEIESFWKDAYPEIDTIPNKITQMQDAGYIPAASFILPENCWTEHFYAPQIPVQEAFLKKHRGNKAVEALIAGQRYEQALYNKYRDYYGYVFYIGRLLP